MASEICLRWTEWSSFRSKKIEEWKELNKYLFATSTATTANAVLPWSNTTTTPKLTQIMDNLHANYFATLFPQQKWMRWEGSDKTSNAKAKRKAIQAYLDNKISQSNFVNTASELLFDWIQYGNCFATVTWEDLKVVKENGEYTPIYTGPKLVRISPFDIVFNPVSSEFAKSPKIIRSVMSLGELAAMPEYKDIAAKMYSNREQIAGSGHVNFDKTEAFVADGFSDINHYYESGYCEILTFYGDYFNLETNTLQKNRVITVFDRAYIASNVEGESWFGVAPIFHSAWRTRPDNLYGMGPLDNLVGMQYRIDHLENLKADVFDQIAYPVMKIRGEVEDFDFEPGARIYIGEEGDVDYLHPDPMALQADMQIKILEDKMEMMAGAPREAMGIRSPGEKTAFEVQMLQNSASRIFEHKAAHFERTFIEPILNAMLEVARRKMDRVDILRVLDDATNVASFLEVKKDDIKANGKIVPIGARHFAERARRVQNLQQLFAFKKDDPSIAPHLSGKKLAQLMAEELGEPDLFGENIAVIEQLETQQVAQDAEAVNQDNLALSAEAGI
jgi:hypothetical protein